LFSRASIETMRDPNADLLTGSQAKDQFARFYYKNGETESRCLRCFVTIVPRGLQTLEDAQRIHVCAESPKPVD
jgi:hypothetical protein